MTRLLFFYPSNGRTVQLETTILAMHHRSVEVELLTTCPEGPLHTVLRREGITVHAHPLPSRPALFYYMRQIAFLIRFCRRRRIDVVFSNLQHANVIAAVAQYFTRARVVLFRHHFKFVFPDDPIPLTANSGERLFDQLINRLGRTTVVPSQGVYDGMRSVERLGRGRVIVLPYIYDFRRYDEPDWDAVAQCRARYPAQLTLLMVGRLIPFKRQHLAFSAVAELIAEGLDIRMLVLGDGPERSALDDFVRRHGMEERIIMLGFRDDVVDFMAASDVLVHPSLTEASSSAVKEMGLLGKPSIVCEGVGDFDDYVEHGKTGLVVPRASTGADIAAVIRECYAEPAGLRRMGRALRQVVIDRFGQTEDRIDAYLGLIT